MKNKAHRITGYSFAPTDQLLFDANIWLYIYGPQGSPTDWKTKTYSAALAETLKAKSRLYLDVLVLSEFINSYARWEHRLLHRAGAAPADFKTFRRTVAFKPIARDIMSDVRRVVKQCVPVESGFESVDIAALLAEYEAGESDFNDQILAELCKSKGLKLVTHDIDFKNRGLTVLTANNRLLV